MTTPPVADGNASDSRFRRVTRYLGLNRSIFGLLSMVILVGMGEKMAERFLPLYGAGRGRVVYWDAQRP